MIIRMIKLNLTAQLAAVMRRFSGLRRGRGALAPVIWAAALLYILGTFAVLIGSVFKSLLPALYGAGMGWSYFSIAGIAVFVLCFVSGIFTTQAQLFAARDNELLLSMPIKPSAILIGRVASLLVWDYLLEAVILLPAAVIWAAGGYASVPGVLVFIICAVALPLLSLAPACLLGWIVALATSRMRNKNIVTTVLSLLFMFGYFRFFNSLSENMAELIANGTAIADAVRRVLPPFYHLGAAIVNGSPVSLAVFLLSALIPFAVTCAILSRTFIAVTTMRRGAKRRAYRERATSASGAFTALVRRELGVYLSNPMYILNASLGSIAALALAALLIIRRDIVLSYLVQIADVLPGVTPALVSAAVLTLLAAFNYVSAPSVSLEGKYLWIARSLPVKTLDILLAKAALHFITVAIPSVIAGIVCAAVFGLSSAAELALILLAPLCAGAMCAMLGLVLNILFPNLEWISMMQPIKRSVSAFVSSLGSMALVAALGAAYIYVLQPVMTLSVFILLCSAVFAGGAAALYGFVATSGVRRFEELKS